MMTPTLYIYSSYITTGGDNTKKLSVNISRFAAVILCCLLAGCSEKAETEEITSFRVIANGTTAEEIRANASYADFYIPKGMVTAYGSRELTAEEKKIFEQTRGNMGRFETEVLLSSDSFRYAKILDLIRFEELSFFPLKSVSVGNWSAAESAFMVTMDYYENAGDSMTRINMECEDVAESIMAGIKDDMDDFDKLKYIHDWLIINCETDSSDTDSIYSSTVYGALVRKKALCEGYAKAFSYLCNLAEIENCIVVGKVNLDHMWNMVKIDGNWYHVDVTYDHPDEFISAEHPEFVSYQYFCVPDVVIENDHVIYSYAFTPPAANAVNESYFNREGYLINEMSEAETVTARAVADAVREGRTYASVKCDSTDLYMKVRDSITAAGGFNNIAEKVKTATGIEPTYSTSDYYSKYRILTFFISYPETLTDSDL